MRTFLSLLIVMGFANATLRAATKEKHMENKTEFAVFGGGCFWCTEAVFEHVPGVHTVVSGYAGGHVETPSYEAVCSGTTDHAEVIRIGFDPDKVTYEQLLDVFWRSHDPTTLNRQGADKGTQYRSIILYANEAQKTAAEKSKAAAQAMFSNPIVTEITPLTEFYAAEEHHQDYFAKNPHGGYCQVVIRPKVNKLQKQGVISKD